MRSITVKWKNLTLVIPGEFVLFLLTQAALLLEHLLHR